MNQWPEAFLHRIGGQLGSELSDFLHALEEPPLRGIRFHPLRPTEGLLAGDRLGKIPWMENSWYLKAESDAGRMPEHEAGAYYLQDPCAMIPARVMNARPGEILLDLCAAPGGKSTQMGTDLCGEGLLICNEPVPKRAQVLSRNVERMGIPNAVVTCAYPEQLRGRWPDAFDGVLADVPCSGEGMFRRQPETIAEWSEERAEGCVQRQEGILEEAARMVRPGGRLIYSTCTWNPEENEKQIRRFLERHPEYSLAPFELPGIHAPEGMFTCWLHRILGEGQFVARLLRDGNGKARLPRGKSLALTKAENRTWCEIGKMLPEPTGRLGSCLYHLPEAPEVEGLRVLRIGLHLGEIRGKTAVPDHAAAVCFHAPQVQCMDLDGAEALRYLAGESLEGNAAGWILMRYHGLVLGWGKGSEGRIRNHYPKGLRNERLITEEEWRS